MVSGWVHCHQLIVIEFLPAENRLLQERLRGRRIRFADAERALLARKAKAVGRKSPARTRHHSLSGYSVAVASAVLRKNSIQAIGAEYEHESHGMMSA
ncbi:MAG TPA: hypothetical protein VN989_14105, partial [Casimicrobiaceae bacterium]|nr:hypothetical protein [Casimicrobiaceae bacterium]